MTARPSVFDSPSQRPAWAPRAIVAGVLAVLLLLVTGCRGAPFDLGLSLEVAGEDDGDGGAVAVAGSRYVLFEGGSDVTTVLDTATMTFSPGPTPPQSVIIGDFHLIGAGPRAGQYLLTSISSSTLWFDPAGGPLGSFTAGPVLSLPYGSNAMSFVISGGGPLDGGVFFFAGSGSATTDTYDPLADSLVTGPAAPITTGGPGSHAVFVGPTGTTYDNTHIFLVDGETNTMVYDPSIPDFLGTPPTLPVAVAGDGAHTFERSDGTLLTLIGGGTTDVVSFDPPTGLFATEAAWPCVVGSGAHTTRLTTGSAEFLTVCGNNSGQTVLYDDDTDTAAAGSALTDSADDGALTIRLTDGPDAGKLLVVHAGNRDTTTILEGDGSAPVPGPTATVPITIPTVLKLN